MKPTNANDVSSSLPDCVPDSAGGMALSVSRAKTSCPERAGGLQDCGQAAAGLGEPARRHLGHDRRSRLPLGRAVVEDGRPVLRALVVALPVQGGWVVEAEEEFDELGVVNANKVELNSFGVSSITTRHSLIGRGLTISSRVA